MRCGISYLGNIIFETMDDEDLDEFTDEQFIALDRMVENLPKNEQNRPNRGNVSALKRGRTSSFEGITDEQLAAIDNEVENVNKSLCSKRSRLKPQEEDLADFGELTSTQLNSLDQEVETFTLQRQQQQRQQHTTTLTASQLELAAAVFDDDENEPSFDHLECLRTRFKHDRFRDKQWEIIRAVMIEKRDVCAVMATGYGKSLCFQVLF